MNLAKRRTTTLILDPEVYDRLRDYAARHHESMNAVVNFHLELSIPSPEEDARIEAMISMMRGPRRKGSPTA